VVGATSTTCVKSRKESGQTSLDKAHTPAHNVHRTLVRFSQSGSLCCQLHFAHWGCEETCSRKKR
jgi:hypothetical protein